MYQTALREKKKETSYLETYLLKYQNKTIWCLLAWALKEFMRQVDVQKEDLLKSEKDWLAEFAGNYCKSMPLDSFYIF